MFSVITKKYFHVQIPGKIAIIFVFFVINHTYSKLFSIKYKKVTKTLKKLVTKSGVDCRYVYGV